MLYYATELSHHGVKGMKWGIRKNRQSPTDTKKSDKSRTIRNAAIAASVVIGASAAAYALHRYGNANFDRTIKSGTQIQHMSRTTNELLNKPFYASYLKSDNRAYAKADFFGAHWTAKMTAASSKNLRVAGRKNAEKIYKTWLNSNSDAKNRFKNQSYYSFNRNLNSPDMRDKKLFSSFYNKLEKHGYDAIRDLNDQTQSGRVSPVIIFGSIGSIKVKDIQPIKK